MHQKRDAVGGGGDIPELKMFLFPPSMRYDLMGYHSIAKRIWRFRLAERKLNS